MARRTTYSEVSGQHNLFQSHKSEEPLAARMRPRTVDEFVGQEHILGEGRLLRRAIQADMLTSVIFSGPPGTGKTTLARVIANTTESRFVSLNAVLSGVKDVRVAIDEADEHRRLHGRRTILFVDEVHRWNKAQQDALLPWVENGTVILIGATTENPFFEVNAALVSRSRIFQLKPLGAPQLYRIAHNTLSDPDRGYGALGVEIDNDALDHLIGVADGDARSLLNALQLAVETTPDTFPPPRGTTIHVTRDVAEDSIQRKAVLYDKEGDYHFDTVSAFIKSLRGSDPDAGLYWLAKMVAGGEDPRYMFRRMLILAAEDVGMADPQALVIVEAAARAFDRVGMPEGRFHLSQAALYLATCAKSNSTLGFFDALSAVEEEKQADVPRHLRDANRDAKGFGHGEGYLYPHAYTEHWVAQNYLPGELRDRIFYQPSNQGWENRIREEVERRREIQLSLAIEPGDDADILTFSPESRNRGRRPPTRQDETRSRILNDIRDRLAAGLKRHETVLLGGSSPLPVLWELLRRTPEGGVFAALTGGKALDTARAQAQQLPELERPHLVECDILEAVSAPERMGLPARFDRIVGRNILGRRKEKVQALESLADALNEGGRLMSAESVPSAFKRLSDLGREARIDAELSAAVEQAEQKLFSDRENATLNWGPDDLSAFARQAGLSRPETEVFEYEDSRLITEEDLRAWIFGREAAAERGGAHGGNGGARSSGGPRGGPDNGAHGGSEAAAREKHFYAAALSTELGEAELQALFEEICAALCNREITWPTTVVFLSADL